MLQITGTFPSKYKCFSPEGRLKETSVMVSALDYRPLDSFEGRKINPYFLK